MTINHFPKSVSEVACFDSNFTGPATAVKTPEGEWILLGTLTFSKLVTDFEKIFSEVEKDLECADLKHTMAHNLIRMMRLEKPDRVSESDLVRMEADAANRLKESIRVVKEQRTNLSMAKADFSEFKHICGLTKPAEVLDLFSKFTLPNFGLTPTKSVPIQAQAAASMQLGIPDFSEMENSLIKSFSEKGISIRIIALDNKEISTDSIDTPSLPTVYDLFPKKPNDLH